MILSPESLLSHLLDGVEETPSPEVDTPAAKDATVLLHKRPYLARLGAQYYGGGAGGASVYSNETAYFRNHHRFNIDLT